MSNFESISRRKFSRNRDRAVVSGVCAGLADYFGFNLTATRVLAVIALFSAFPMTLLAYFGAVFLFPSLPGVSHYSELDAEFQKALRSAPSQTLGDVRRRYQSLDSRLARLERYVTSSRFDLDQEFSKL